MKSMPLALQQLSIGTLLAVGFNLLCGLSMLLAVAIAFKRQVVFQGVAQLERIAAVTGVIQGLMEQSNLLAAIEAARAGDMGRDFSVLADEVLSLANRTQGSAAEIATMIESLQRDGKSVLNHVERAGEESIRAREYSS
ncbi:methyl-accepting chemotaxis protein [Pseudomonas capsici]|uniref:methyl-accepting chemotaxis protein n=1 Tax=Pseudomonas capsici TaxID=2810614 RepID=UPI00298DB90A|nr:methyl-accepting chemotaxis protein [Pseudomonas capsici]